MSKPVLLSSYLSSCGWRVRIVLEVKKIDFKYHPVYLWPDTGEQQSEKFKTMNPMGQVPVLLVDGKPISQSVAIMEYLEEMYPEPRMLPADAYPRAKCREVVELLVSGVQPIQTIGLIPILGRVEWKKWAERNITRGFTALEAIFAETAGKYCFGDGLTFADACLVPQVCNAYRFGIDVTPFPKVRQIYEALQQHPLVQKAEPSRQPDTPPMGVPDTPNLFKGPGDQ